jgi:succinyl-diaminopimelate desuccinylase
VAYPHVAKNPIPDLVKLLAALEGSLDDGNENFQPSNLEIVNVDVGNDSHNVIPAEARARFNVRFNNEYSPESLCAELTRRLDSAGVGYEIDWWVSGDSFLTPPGPLSDAVQAAVQERLGVTPELSTTGGTSDARFIKDMCPVVEFGLVGATMHKIDEHVAVADIEALTDIYEGVIRRLLGA